MASKEMITQIIIKGKADSSLTKAFQAVSKNSDTCIGKLSKIGDTAKKAFKVVAAAAAAGAVACGKAAIDFESAFAGVQKTVDETDTTSYEDLANGIRQLAKETPAAATEIADVAAAAGQLGIKADDVLTFSKTMIDLGESTNLTSEEAATSIAKLFNITGTSMDKVGNFGSTLVALGNNAATTESDILAMTMRIAGTGSQIGLTEQQVLALATSLSSVGIEAEAGGTAISTTMSQIDKAVALNSEELAIWAETAGMSASDFSNAWKEDAYSALQQVMKGMATTKDEGGNLNVLLEELGINGIRQGDSLKRLANATGLMSEMTDLANKSWSDNAALTKEANTRYATTASRIKILKNKITDAAITIGNALLPVINKLIDKFDEIDIDAIAGKIAKGCNWIIDNFGKIKVALGIFAAAFAAIKLTSFIKIIRGAVKEVKILYSVLEGAGKLKGLSTLLGTFKSGGFVAGMKAIGTSISGAFSGAAAAIGVSAGALLGIIAVVALVVAAFVSLWKNNEEFRNKMLAIWEQIKGTWDKLTQGIVDRLNKLGFDFENFGEVISAIWEGLCNFLAPIFEGAFQYIAIIFDGVVNHILSVADFWISLFKGDWQGCWEAVKNIFSNIWNTVVAIFKNKVNVMKNLFNVVLGWFGTSWDECWSKIKNFFVNIWNGIKSFFTNTASSIKTGFSNFISSIVNWFKELPNKIWTFLQELPYKIGYLIGLIIGKIVLFGKKLWNFATVTVPQFIGKVVEFFKQLPSKIWTWLVQTWNKFVAWRNNMYAKALQIGRDVLNAIVNFFKQLPSKVWTWLVNTVQKIGSWGTQMVAKAKQAASDTFNAVVNKIKELPSKMLSLGKDIVHGLWNGIKNAKDWLIGKIKSFANGITDGIKKALGINSPSVVMTKLAKFIPQGVGVGITKYAKYAVDSVKNLGGKISSAASKALPTLSTGVNVTAANLPKYGTGGTVTSPHAAIVGDRNETIVPHGNTPRNRSLLAEAAAGVGDSSRGDTFNFTFAPVINGGNAEENRAMLQDEEEAFERRMNEWLAKNRRLAF